MKGKSTFTGVISNIGDCWKVSSVVPLRILGSLQLKTTTVLVFFMWLVKSLKNL